MDDLITGATADERAASSAVRTHCRWHIAPVITETVTVSSDGDRWLMVPTLALRTVTSITNRYTGELVPVNEYDGRWYGALCRIDERLWVGTYDVVFTHGFETCPDDVKAVVGTLVHAGTFAIGNFETAALGLYRLPVLQ